MSAIGSYALLTRTAYEQCLASARNVRSEQTGKWIFKQTQLVGLDEFQHAWQQAAPQEVDFDYSGYVIGNYLDAQSAINLFSPIDEESEELVALAKVFTAAYPFKEKIQFPDLPENKLRTFCTEEYGEDDAAGMSEAIKAAHEFYRRGLAEISEENMVVFIIR